MLVALAPAASRAEPRGPAAETPASPQRAPDIEGARTIHVERSAPQQDAIDRIEVEREALRARLEAARREEPSLLTEMSRLDQQAALARDDERLARLKADDEAAQARAWEERAKALRLRAAATRRRLVAVVGALYRSAPSEGLAGLLLEQGSAGSDTGSLLARRQSQIAAELAGAERAARAADAESRRRGEAAVESARDAAARAGDASRARDARGRRLREISSDRQREGELSVAIVRAEAGLQQDLGSGRWSSPSKDRIAGRPVVPRTDLRGLSDRRGRIRWPLAARGEIRSGFGEVIDPRRGTRTMRHGITLAAPEGTPIVAIASGRVVFADWYKGFGRIVVIDHGAGWLSVLAHLRGIDVEAGANVEEGQRVGDVGDTGSLEGPVLYLQMSHDGEPVDPRIWLER